MKKSLIKSIALVVLALLILVAGVIPLVGGTRILGINPRMDLSGSGQFQRNLPEGGIPPEGALNPPGGDLRQFSGFEGDQGNQFPGNPADFSGSPRSGLQGPESYKLQRLIQFGLGGAILLFGILALIGLILNRRWGKALSVITAAIVLVSTIPSIFRPIGGISLIEAIVKIVLAVIIVIFIFIKPTNSIAMAE